MTVSASKWNDRDSLVEEVLANDRLRNPSKGGSTARAAVPSREGNAMMSKRFSLGRILATKGAIEAVPNYRLLQCIARHAAGDWGEALPLEDARENDFSVQQGFRILSAYYIDPDQPKIGKFWIITECDRSVTTVLLPEEY